jgi:hypothetical protein
MTRKHIADQYRAYELLELKARILRICVAAAGGFSALILILGLLGKLK